MEPYLSDTNELLEQAKRLGFEYEKIYRGCAQCTVAAVQDTLGIGNPLLFKAACGLGAGGGLLCDGVCGGYSGGIMIMSSIFGRRRDKFDNDNDEKYCAFRMARELHDTFIEKYGSIVCSDIHMKIFGKTFNLLDPVEKDAFNQSGAHEDKCTTVVGDASAWVVQLILAELKERGMSLSDLRKEYLS